MRATTFYTQTNGRYAPDRKQVYRQDASTQNSLTALILAKKLLIPTGHRVLIMSPWKVLWTASNEGLNASNIIKSVSSSQELQQQVAHLFHSLKNAVCFPPQHLALAMLWRILHTRSKGRGFWYRKMAVEKQRLSWYGSKTPNKKFTDIKSKLFWIQLVSLKQRKPTTKGLLSTLARGLRSRSYITRHRS
jgi:long-subunit acyl-CoA synthetase (AMP-forming)